MIARGAWSVDDGCDRPLDLHTLLAWVGNDLIKAVFTGPDGACTTQVRRDKPVITRRRRLPRNAALYCWGAACLPFMIWVASNRFLRCDDGHQACRLFPGSHQGMGLFNGSRGLQFESGRDSKEGLDLERRFVISANQIIQRVWRSNRAIQVHPSAHPAHHAINHLICGFCGFRGKIRTDKPYRNVTVTL